MSVGDMNPRNGWTSGRTASTVGRPSTAASDIGPQFAPHASAASIVSGSTAGRLNLLQYSTSSAVSASSRALVSTFGGAGSRPGSSDNWGGMPYPTSDSDGLFTARTRSLGTTRLPHRSDQTAMSDPPCEVFKNSAGTHDSGSAVS